VTIDVRTAVVAATFAAQILTISFIVPARFRRHSALLFERYPPAEFPRLYPISLERLQREIAILRVLYLLVGIGGLVVLAKHLLYHDDAIELGRVMIWYLLVQYIPVFLRLSLGIRMARAFRAMPPPSVRSADLREWRAVDFIPPVGIGLGLLGSVSALACTGFVYAQSFVSVGFVMVSALFNGWLLFRMLYVLFMPVTFGRSDPYMSQADVFRARQRRFRALFRGGSLLGAYFSFMLLYEAGVVRFDLAYLCVLVSVICQALFFVAAWRMFCALENRDYSVYRSGPPSAGVRTTGPAGEALTDVR